MPSGGRGQRFESSRARQTQTNPPCAGFFVSGAPERCDENLRFDQTPGAFGAALAPRSGQVHGCTWANPLDHCGKRKNPPRAGFFMSGAPESDESLCQVTASLPGGCPSGSLRSFKIALGNFVDQTPGALGVA